MHTLRYGAGLMVTGALIAIGHWFPWPRELKRWEGCALSVAAGLIGLAVWVGFTDAWFAVFGFVLTGSTVALVAYAYDAVLNWRQRARFFRVEDGLDEGRPEDC